MKGIVSEERFEFVIPIKSSRDPLLQKLIINLFKFCPVKTIVFVCPAKEMKYLLFLARNHSDIKVLDEDKISVILSYEKIKKTLVKLSNNEYIERSGWYLQQFIKMYYSYVSNNEYYIVWDADTIPLKPIKFKEQNSLIFTIKNENHLPYYNSVNKLFPEIIPQENLDYSFIAEHMVIKRSIMIEIIQKIDFLGVRGNNPIEKILFSIDKHEIEKSGFSEFELYGLYSIFYYNELYILKKRKTLRIGSYLLGINPSIDQLDWLGKKFSIVSFEKNYIFCFRHLLSNSIALKNLDPLRTALFINRLRKFIFRVFNKRVFDYDWYY